MLQHYIDLTRGREYLDLRCSGTGLGAVDREAHRFAALGRSQTPASQHHPRRVLSRRRLLVNPHFISLTSHALELYKNLQKRMTRKDANLGFRSYGKFGRPGEGHAVEEDVDVVLAGGELLGQDQLEPVAGAHLEGEGLIVDAAGELAGTGLGRVEAYLAARGQLEAAELVAESRPASCCTGQIGETKV